MVTSAFNRVVRLGVIDIGRKVDVFCEIQITDGRLSITGVEGPYKGGHAHGSCGQIVMSLKADEITPAPGWDRDKLQQFLAIWDKWHLNDRRAGSPAQREYLEAHPVSKEDYAYPKSHYEVVSERLKAAGLNPDASGYSYGSAWLTEELPADVVAFLESLPETDKTPAWV